MTRPGAQPNRGKANGRRRAQRLQLARNAGMRSIPRQIAPKPERFQRGLPGTSHTVAPRGLGYYDAFVCQPDALVMASQVGPCTPIEGFTRVNVVGGSGITDLSYPSISGSTTLTTSGLTDNSILFVFNPGSSDAEVARIYRLREDAANAGTAEVVYEEVGVTAFSELGPATSTSYYQELNIADGDPDSVQGPEGRIESIPCRGSMRIRNVTESLAVGGEIRILRYNGGLHLGHDTPGTSDMSSAMGVAEYLNICDMIRDTKRTHTLDGHEVKAAHQSNTYPADHIRSMTFSSAKSFEESVHFPSFCTLLVLVDNFKASASQVNNTYSIGMTVHRAARFKPGTLLHSKAVVPKSHQPTNAANSHLESLKPAISLMRPLMDGVGYIARSPLAGPVLSAGLKGAKAGFGGASGYAIAEEMLADGVGALGLL